MAVESDNFRETGSYYSNLMDLNTPLVERDRLLAEVELRSLSTSRERMSTPSETAETRARLEDVENHIRGNIDALDYLRGISGLERPFTNLIEEILHVALVLSQDVDFSHPQFVYDPIMDEKVDRCWTYITQLTEIVQYHVTHAVQYHKFHHHVRVAQLRLQHHRQMWADTLADISKPQVYNLEEMSRIDTAMDEQMNELNELVETARQLTSKSQALTPLRYRKKLPSGRRSAHALASLRLPDGEWVHRGESVKVWADSNIASRLHHEWQMETMDGTRRATLPSHCFWLTSPEPSPNSSVRDKIRTSGSIYNGSKRRPSRRTSMGDSLKKSISSYADSKALAYSFQNDVLIAWADIIEDLGCVLLPIYRKYMQSMVGHDGAIPMTDIKIMRQFFNDLKPLIAYGTSDDALLFELLTTKPLRDAEPSDSFNVKEMNQLENTLSLWNELRDQLQRAKELAPRRSIQRQSVVEPLESKFRTTESAPPVPKEIPTRASTVHAVDRAGTRELVTSFAEPTPRTFFPMQDHSTQFTTQSDTDESTHGSKRFRFKRTKRMKRTRSQPAAVDTSDLMTQVTTPYVPTLVNCPNCSLAYEVDVYGSALDLSPLDVGDLADRAEQPVSHSPSLISPGLQITATHSIDSPVLPKSPATTLSKEHTSKERKKLFRIPRRRSHSHGRSVVETTGSSGLGSSPDPVTAEMREGRKKRGYSKRKPKGEVQKRPRTPLFSWRKRSKSKTREQGTDEDKLKTTSVDQGLEEPRTTVAGATTSSQPILRSQSWIQQGTPWGYVPPSHEGSLPSITTNNHTDLKPAKGSKIQSHSERLLARISRPKLIPDRRSFANTADGSLVTSTDLPPYNTVDSGIQTDTDMTTGFSDLTTAELTHEIETPRVKNGVCHECGRELGTSTLQDAELQCTYLESLEDYDSFLNKEYEKSSQPLVATASQTAPELFQDRRLNLQVENWDVSCQVGVLQTDCGMFIDMNEIVLPTDVKRVSTAEVQVELEPIRETNQDRLSAATAETEAADHDPSFSVACQIGHVLQENSVGPKTLEEDNASDDSFINRGENDSVVLAESAPTVTQETEEIKTSVGKKLQVGTPWWTEEEKTTSASEIVATGTSPIEELQTVNGACKLCALILSPNIDKSVQTSSESKVVPIVTSVQTQIGTTPLDVASAEDATETQEIPTDIPASSGKRFPTRMTSVSTLIGYVTTSTEQQTEITLSDQLHKTVDQIENQFRIKPLLIVDSQHFELNQSPVLTHTDAPLSALRQPGDSPILSNPLASIEPSVETKQSLKTDAPPAPMVRTEYQIIDEGPLSIHSCPESSAQPGTKKTTVPLIFTRSKRIQKGSPKIDRTYPHKASDRPFDEHTSSDLDVVDDSPQGILTKSPQAEAKVGRSRSSKSPHNHLVLDIEFYKEMETAHHKAGRRRRGRSQPGHVPPPNSEDRDSDKSSDPESSTSLISESADLVRLCLHLDADDNVRVHHRRSPYHNGYAKRVRKCNSRSLSVVK